MEKSNLASKVNKLAWLLSERYNISIGSARILINKDYNKKLLEDHQLSNETIALLIAENDSLVPKAKYSVFKV